MQSAIEPYFYTGLFFTIASPLIFFKLHLIQRKKNNALITLAKYFFGILSSLLFFSVVYGLIAAPLHEHYTIKEFASYSGSTEAEIAKNLSGNGPYICDDFFGSNYRCSLFNIIRGSIVTPIFLIVFFSPVTIPATLFLALFSSQIVIWLRKRKMNYSLKSGIK